MPSLPANWLFKKSQCRNPFSLFLQLCLGEGNTSYEVAYYMFYWYLIVTLIELSFIVTFHRLNSDPNLRLGDVTSLNVTMLSGGVQYNVVPDSMSG